jgi:membrane protease YdiL (CAAX protease family)
MVVKRDIVLAVGSYCVLMALAVKFSLIDGLGHAESEHLATSGWMYVRRIIMIACACVLPLLCRQKGIGSYGWGITRRWLVIAVAVGILMGFGNPGGFDPTSAVAIVLAAFHTFATELYFRAYLITTFARYCKNFWTPIVVSSLMYGLSYLTVYGIFFHPWPYFKIVGVVMFTLLGLVFGYSYRKSQSFNVPWIMHFFGVLKYRMLLG